MAFTTEELNIMIRAIFNDDGAVEEVRNQLKRIVRAYDEERAAAKDAAAETAAAHAAMAAASAKAFSLVRQAVSRGVAAYNEYQAAVKGLNSIAVGKGVDTSALEKSLASVTDAMFDATAAAASFKNLLSRGYSLEQATNTIKRLKDAAAFGRQANLQLADAVKTATDGLKAENSVLVDNSGVQKNVAKMWQDYAKARGITTEAMTQAQKVEAEYLGIMEETALQVGDYAKATNTLAGAQAEAENSAKLLATSYGEALAPAMQVVSEVTSGFLSTMRTLVEVAPDASAGVTATVAAFAGFAAIQKAAAAVKTFTAGMSTLAGGPVTWGLLGIAAAIGVVTSATSSAQRRAQEAADAAREHTEQLEREYRDAQKLASEYRTLSNKTSLTADEKGRLAEIEQTLIGMKDDVVGGIDAQTQAYEDNTQAVKDNAEAKANAQIDALAAVRAEAAKQRLLEEQWEKVEKASLDAKKAEASDSGYLTNPKEYRDSLYANLLNESLLRRYFSDELSEAEKIQMEEMKSATSAARNNFEDIYGPLIDSGAEYIKTKVSDTFGNSDLQNSVAQSIADVFSKTAHGDTFDLKSFDDGYVRKFAEAFENVDLSSVEAAFRQKTADLFTGDGYLKPESQEEYAKAVEETRAELYSYIDAIVAMAENLGVADGELAGFRSELEAYADDMLGVERSMVQLDGGLAETTRAQKTNEEAAKGAAAAIAREGASLFDVEKAAIKAADAQDLLAKKQKLVETSVGYAKQKQYIDVLKKGERETQDYADAHKALADEYGEASVASDENVDALGRMIDANKDATDSAITETDAMAAAAQADLQTILGQLDLFVQMNGSSPALDTVRAQIIAAIQSMDVLQSMTNALAGTGFTGRKGGGGGGKSKAEREAEEAERAAQEAARAQEEAYRNALSRIDHKREMDEISAQEEIDLLREVQRVHAQTEDQRMDISERIYKAEKALAQDRYDAEIERIDRLYDRAEIDAQERIRLLEQVSAAYATNADLQKSIEEELYNARQELRDQETDDIDRLGDGLTTALRARYEEQRDAEEAHLEESKQAWSDWSDETCEAIQAQIDALDKQQEAEDRQKTDANNLRAIDRAKQALEYETDEYNRRNLEKQIAQLEEKRAEQLKKWEVSDQKEELRDEMQAIKDKAEQEQKAIDEEIDRVTALYEERLKAANIQAEAERLLMKGNQEQILDLIASYAPDYEATGKTLGERLFEGIQNAVGSFADWYAAFTERIEEIQYGAVQGALEAADRLHASGGYANAVSKPGERVINVEQNLIFNQPIERPSDVARRVEEMNLELADVL